jgi:hypothetical protein
VTSESDRDRALERLLRGMTGPDAPTPACLDFEQLAAWSDGGVPAMERRAIESHLASCGRCQELAAAFAKTAPVAAPPRPVWQRPFARWVVPVAAAAAATVIWMVLPDDRGATTLTPSTTTARVESPGEPAAGAAPAAEPEREDRQMAARDRAPRPVAPSDDAAVRQEQSRETSSTTTATPFAKAGEGSADSARQSALPAAPPPPPPAAAPVAAPTLADRSAAAPVAEETLSRLAAQSATALIMSPDPARRWRIAGGGVERSDDAGASWQRVTLPPGSAPIAGAAPARDVCWLIGPAGAVLRTTNGTHFEMMTIPSSGNLRAISAQDADRATVTAVTGRVFRTADGGRTWE